MKAIIYVHGKGGSHLEAKQYEKNCIGFDIIGVDYSDYQPQIVKEQIETEYERLSKIYDDIYLIANSIGAYFSMLALQNVSIKKALFISPIADMEKLILDMLCWAGSSEEDLIKKGEIHTDFGETLSFSYLAFVRDNKIVWNVPTEILYAEKDNLTSRETIESFAKTHGANLTIMPKGEHWFHTKGQLEFLDSWMKKAIII